MAIKDGLLPKADFSYDPWFLKWSKTSKSVRMGGTPFFHAAITAMKNEFGVIVTKVNVTSNLRTILKRWAQIKKLKELS